MLALRRIIPTAQFGLILQLKGGEESGFFDIAFEELKRIQADMPRSYDTDGHGDNAVAHLHYFAGDCHWYITELDVEEEQNQAFGLAILNGDLQCAEVGYISLVELVGMEQVELDLHWTPKPLADVRKALKTRYGG